MFATEDELFKLCPSPRVRAAVPVAFVTPEGQKLYWVADVRNFRLRGCAYIKGDTNGYWQFCNQPTLMKSTYCAGHYALTHRNVKSLTDQALAAAQALLAGAGSSSEAAVSARSASAKRRSASPSLDQLLSQLLSEL